MSGAGAGSSIGLSGLQLELLAQDAADRPQQWNDAPRATMAQVARPADVELAPTTSVPGNPAAVAADAAAKSQAVMTPALRDPALALPAISAPSNLPASAQPLAVVAEEMTAAGPEQRPVALTDPTPSIDPMAPVVSPDASANVGPGDPSGFAASPALPQQLVSVLLAAGYRPGVANLPAGGRSAATTSDPAPVSASLDSAAQVGAAAGSSAQGTMSSASPAAAGAALAKTQTTARFALSSATTAPARQAVAEKNSLSPAATWLSSSGRSGAATSDRAPVSAGLGGATQAGAVAGSSAHGTIPSVSAAAAPSATAAPLGAQTTAGFALSFATTAPGGQAVAEKNSLSSAATSLPSSGRSGATASDPAPVSAELGGATQAAAVAGSSAHGTIPSVSATAVPAAAPLGAQTTAGFALSFATTAPGGQAVAEASSVSPVATPLLSSGRSGVASSDPAPVSAALGGATQAGVVAGSSAQGTIPPVSAAVVAAAGTAPLDPQAIAGFALSFTTAAAAGQLVAEKSSGSRTVAQLPPSRGSTRSATTSLSGANQGRGLPAVAARAGSGSSQEPISRAGQEPVSRVAGPTGAASAGRSPGTSAQGAGGRSDAPSTSGPAVAAPPVASGTGVGSASAAAPHATGPVRPMTGGSISAPSTGAHHSASRYEPVIVIVPARDVVGAARGPLTRRRGRAATGDPPLVSYAERRQMPIDIAPVSPEVVAWRLDDTQALAPVGPSNAATAAARAAELYRALMDEGTGLAAIEPGAGFITWAGSPLWLSLAGISKPAALGVLPVATPGRVQVMRTEGGEWLVEHAGGIRPASRALCHEASAGDHEALLLDVLYGVAGTTPDSAALQRFEWALGAMRFARGAPQPMAWRAQEAWGMVARCCAAAGAQPGFGSADSDRALEAALAALVDGPALAIPSEPRAFPLLGRERCIAMLLSGNRNRIAAALGVLGRAALDQVSRGCIDGIGPLESVALALSLGRLTTSTLTRFAARTDLSRGAGEVLLGRRSL